GPGRGDPFVRRPATSLQTALTRVLVGSIALTLVACAAVGPDYRRPQVALSTQFPRGETELNSSDSVVSSTWWTLYGDARLTRLVEAALEHNDDVEQAVARVEQASAQLRQVAAAFLPEVDVGANASRSRISGRALGSPTGRGAVGDDLRVALSTSFE